MYDSFLQWVHKFLSASDMQAPRIWQQHKAIIKEMTDPITRSRADDVIKILGAHFRDSNRVYALDRVFGGRAYSQT